MQRVPKVSHDDVLRVIHRDYPAADVATALSILDGYGSEPWEREPDRVRLAVLKLAAGSVPELRRQVEAARRDYRDALAEAEYPESLVCMGRARPLTAGEVEAAHERDWDQYRLWLAKE